MCFKASVIRVYNCLICIMRSGTVLFFKHILKDFIYLFEEERTSRHRGGVEREEKADSLAKQGAHVGLRPRTLAS